MDNPTDEPTAPEQTFVIGMIQGESIEVTESTYEKYETVAKQKEMSIDEIVEHIEGIVPLACTTAQVKQTITTWDTDSTTELPTTEDVESLYTELVHAQATLDPDHQYEEFFNWLLEAAEELQNLLYLLEESLQSHERVQNLVEQAEQSDCSEPLSKTSVAQTEIIATTTRKLVHHLQLYVQDLPLPDTPTATNLQS